MADTSASSQSPTAAISLASARIVGGSLSIAGSTIGPNSAAAASSPPDDSFPERQAWYEGGHVMNIHEPSMKTLHKDVEEFDEAAGVLNCSYLVAFANSLH